jgi:hypothetical protein
LAFVTVIVKTSLSNAGGDANRYRDRHPDRSRVGVAGISEPRLPLSVKDANAGRFDAAKRGTRRRRGHMITSVVAPSLTVWSPIGLSTGGR